MAAAEKLFRERGVDAVGLTELMKAAGFTHGSFDNHFKSKDALVATGDGKGDEGRNPELRCAIRKRKGGRR